MGSKLNKYKYPQSNFFFPIPYNKQYTCLFSIFLNVKTSTNDLAKKNWRKPSPPLYKVIYEAVETISVIIFELNIYISDSVMTHQEYICLCVSLYLTFVLKNAIFDPRIEYIKCRIPYFLIMKCCRNLVFYLNDYMELFKTVLAYL